MESEIILLQTDIATNFLSEIVQAGIAFTIMVVIIVVLARRVLKLEKKIEEMIADEKKDAKENILIIKGATEAMQKVAKKLGTND